MSILLATVVRFTDRVVISFAAVVRFVLAVERLLVAVFSPAGVAAMVEPVSVVMLLFKAVVLFCSAVTLLLKVVAEFVSAVMSSLSSGRFVVKSAASYKRTPKIGNSSEYFFLRSDVESNAGLKNGAVVGSLIATPTPPIAIERGS